MCYKLENDPTSQEAVEMCEQVAKQNDPSTPQTVDSHTSAPKQFLLTLDVERDKLSTEDCDSILSAQFHFSRKHGNDTLPESSYLGKIRASENTSALFDKIIKALQEKSNEPIEIKICGGFVEKFQQKRTTHDSKIQVQQS